MQNKTQDFSSQPKPPQPQLQLRKPFCQRGMRFTVEGYEALAKIKTRLEAERGRPISESVALNILLTGAASI